MKTLANQITIFIAILAALILTNSSILAQNVNIEFGKNRVQYHDFEWWQYETPNFIVYWYKEGRNIGETVVQMAELDHEEIRSLMEYRISDKIEILVYTDLTDLKQSNIGNEDVFITNGQTKIIDNKMFVYFDGDHNNLRRQIRAGMAYIYINYMMYGSSLQEIVQNAVLLHLPTWFNEGLVEYVGEPWNTDLDNLMRDVIISNQITSFDELVEENPLLAGHSFWYFLSENYGKATVSNLLYLTRINRSVENGFLYVLGTSYERIKQNWYNFYLGRYGQDEKNGTALDAQQRIPIKNKRDAALLQLQLSPNGQTVAYVVNELGKQQVYTQTVGSKKRKKALQTGYKNIFQATDYNYPLLKWLPNGQKLAIVYEKRDKIKLLLYDVAGGKSETIAIPDEYERILSIDFVDNRQMVLTAVRAGYSDVYLFDTRTRQTRPITRDYHDDLDAAAVTINGVKGIIFSSNRDDSLLVNGLKLDSLLPIKTFDLYFYDLKNKKSTELVRLTNTPFANESKPVAIDDRYFGFLSNAYGTNNRQVGYIDTVFAYKERVYKLKDGEELVLPVDSTLSSLPENALDTMFIRDVFKPRGFHYPNTNYKRGILSQSTAPRVGKVATAFFNNGNFQFYLSDLDAEQKVAGLNTGYIQTEIKKRYSINSNNYKVKEKTINTNVQPKKTVVPSPQPTQKDTLPPKPKVEQPKQDTGKIDIDNYFFQSEFEDEADDANKATNIQPKPVEVEIDEQPSISVKMSERVAEAQPANKAPLEFRRSKIRPYQTQFQWNTFTDINNDLLFGGISPTLNQNSPGSPNPLNSYVPLSLLLGISVDDLFQDYSLILGMRIPIAFNGTEYFAIFDDKSSRLDKRYALYRSQYAYNESVNLFGTNNTDVEYDLVSNIAEVQLRYPLDIYQSFRGTLTGRIDNVIYQSETPTPIATPISLELDNSSQQRIGLRLEYIFDNTIDVSLNIKNGSSIRAVAEVQNRFELSLLDSVYFNGSTGFLGIVGVDARHYQRLDRHSIVAARFATYSTFGSDKVLYFLGGTNNWLGATSNNEIPVPASSEFAYQGLATNMRGFRSNIRNGNSYALMNVELRVPFVKYLTQNTINSSFIRNLQVIGFYDIGTAWQGFSPFVDDNPLNTDIIQNPNSPIRVKVNYFRNPIVMGYGLGLRSTILGQYVRLDYAWGVETGIVQEPRFYFSLGTDF